MVLASLNHPSIAAIHGLEEADGVRALVLRTRRRADARGSQGPRADPAGLGRFEVAVEHAPRVHPVGRARPHAPSRVCPCSR